MRSWYCTTCGNSDTFVTTYNGIVCGDCFSEWVTPTAEIAHVYIPPTDSGQITELERIFTLSDGRVEAPGLEA